jgi:hypothetical protein
MTGTESAFGRGMKFFYPMLVGAVALGSSAHADLVATLAASAPEGPSVKIAQTVKTSLSATSARFKSNKVVQNGVPESNRDFGQTFTTGAEPFYLDRITVQLGGQPISPSVFGAAISVQLCEVGGKAVVNDNGTKEGKVAPWCDDPRVDDFIEGETFTTLTTARGGQLPAFMIPGQLLVLNFRKGDRIKLKANTQYAFVWMFDEAGVDRSLSFATSYWSTYEGGHAIRRDGEIPADMSKRVQGALTTKAGTKSDVFSDMIFWVEGSATAGGGAAVAAVEAAKPGPALPLPSR